MKGVASKHRRQSGIRPNVSQRDVRHGCNFHWPQFSSGAFYRKKGYNLCVGMTNESLHSSGRFKLETAVVIRSYSNKMEKPQGI